MKAVKQTLELCLPLALELGKISVHPGAASVEHMDLPRFSTKTLGWLEPGAVQQEATRRAGKKKCRERRSSENSCISPWLKAILILSHMQESEQIHLRILQQLKLQGSFSFSPELSAVLNSGRLKSRVEQSCSGL